MSKIKNVVAREILDSRGNPTVEVKLTLENNISVKAAVPSGASTGKHEALELRDHDDKRFGGKGVLKACKNVNETIGLGIVGKEPNPKDVDEVMLDMDGTKNKGRLGANATLAVSLASARAGALDTGLPLYKFIRDVYQLPDITYKFPTPMFNVINGGIHSDSGLDLQEFIIMPMGGDSFQEKIRIGAEIFSALKQVLRSKNLGFAVGDEGGYAPKLKNTQAVFETLISISEYTKHELGNEIFFGLDVAASIFYNERNDKYFFENKKRSNLDMLKVYQQWLTKYPLATIEDPFAEDDWDAWPELTKYVETLNNKFLVIGDDLFTTNVERLKKGIKNKAANAILIKPNQIGTLSETINCINLAQDNNYKIVISHRSGETNDDFISDLAVAVMADFIKAGAPNRGERVAKYNRLLEIEQKVS